MHLIIVTTDGRWQSTKHGNGKNRGAPASQGNLREETAQLEVLAASLRKQMGDEAYYRLAPVFTEMPFIRPMGHNTQLPNTIRYIDMNPQRLATKRLKPGLFHVQRDITVSGRSYDGVGNTTLLMSGLFEPVHVKHELADEAARGNNLPLRNYMNSRVLAARKGVVMCCRTNGSRLLLERDE